MPQRRFDQALYERFVREQSSRLLAPPAIQADPSVRYWPEVDDYTMSAGFARTPKGRIWLSWFGGEDNDEAVMLAAYSDDEGRTFSAPQFVIDDGCVAMTHISSLVGNFWTDPDGRLWWFFTHSLGYFDGRAGLWYAICDNPDADRPVWSTPKRMGHGCLLNKPIVTRDGTWLAPLYLWPRTKIGFNGREGYWFGEKSGLYHELDAERKSWIYASTDRGQTWTRRGGVAPVRAHTFDEPSLVERKDGSLWMMMRTDEGTVSTESFDQGRSWSEPKPFNQPNASARFFLTKLASGNLLLVFHANLENRTARSHLTARLSRDDGRTWEGGLLLDVRQGVSYPDGFQAPDGRIFVQYDYLRRHGELLRAIFTEADVLAGRDVSGKVQLRHPMVQSRSRREQGDA